MFCSLGLLHALQTSDSDDLTLSGLTLPLSSSSITSPELLSQFSTCMIWCGWKSKENCHILVNQFQGNIYSKTLVCRKIKSVFRDLKWCFNASRGLKGLKSIPALKGLIYVKRYSQLYTQTVPRCVWDWYGYRSLSTFVCRIAWQYGAYFWLKGGFIALLALVLWLVGSDWWGAKAWCGPLTFFDRADIIYFVFKWHKAGVFRQDLTLHIFVIQSYNYLVCNHVLCVRCILPAFTFRINSNVQLLL